MFVSPILAVVVVFVLLATIVSILVLTLELLIALVLLAASPSRFLFRSRRRSAHAREDGRELAGAASGSRRSRRVHDDAAASLTQPHRRPAPVRGASNPPSRSPYHSAAARWRNFLLYAIDSGSMPHKGLPLIPPGRAAAPLPCNLGHRSRMCARRSTRRIAVRAVARLAALALAIGPHLRPRLPHGELEAVADRGRVHLAGLYR